MYGGYEQQMYQPYQGGFSQPQQGGFSQPQFSQPQQNTGFTPPQQNGFSTPNFPQQQSPAAPFQAYQHPHAHQQQHVRPSNGGEKPAPVEEAQTPSFTVDLTISDSAEAYRTEKAIKILSQKDLCPAPVQTFEDLAKYHVPE